jgi:hypothetical protein
MGQMVLGVMLGCRMSPALQRKLEGGLLSDWNNKQTDFHDRVDRASNAGGSDTDVIGVWVIHEEGFQLDEPLSVRDIENSKRYAFALRQWKKFRNWARRQHAKVPSARLFIAKAEVA